MNPSHHPRVVNLGANKLAPKAQAARQPRVKVVPVDKLAMIAEAAYYRAEKRNFDPGHELTDWLAAEADVEAALLVQSPSAGD